MNEQQGRAEQGGEQQEGCETRKKHHIKDNAREGMARAQG
jgi:hypothetical protein